MLRKAPFLFIAIIVLSAASTALAQSPYKFLGPKKKTEIKYSPKYRIPYNDNGFSDPAKRKWKQAAKRGAQGFVIEEIQIFPGTPEAIGEWIDEAGEEAVASFKKWGGPRAEFAEGMTLWSRKGGVSTQPTIWYEPVL